MLKKLFSFLLNARKDKKCKNITMRRDEESKPYCTLCWVRARKNFNRMRAHGIELAAHACCTAASQHSNKEVKKVNLLYFCVCIVCVNVHAHLRHNANEKGCIALSACAHEHELRACRSKI